MSLIRIFVVDFYMSPPVSGLDVVYSDFRSSAIYNVPIIRIFGTSPEGKKTCLHIHGVFPYIYIPYEGTENASSTMYQITNRLEEAINISLGQSTSNAQHIYKISLVSGIPFYGYHKQEHQFFKIYFYNPLIMKRASNLLQNGQILDKIYQLHEAHVPFVLQFMIDYNLHGMNFISLSQVRYRVNPSSSQTNITPEFYLSTVAKISTCEIEIDCLAENIVNRFELTAGELTKNPGIAALWEDEKQRLRNKHQPSQIPSCISQDRIDIEPTSSHNMLKKTLEEKTQKKCMNKDNYSINSVYPKETPKLGKLLSASLIENHNSSSTDYHTSSNETLSDSSLIDCNSQTTFCENLNDTDDRNLLEILLDLEQNAAEDDSILSQTIKYDDESDPENELDMSLPLITTPIKIESQSDGDYNINETIKQYDLKNLQSEDANFQQEQDSFLNETLVDEDIVDSSLEDPNDILNKTIIEEKQNQAKRILSFNQIHLPLNAKGVCKVNSHGNIESTTSNESDEESIHNINNSKYYVTRKWDTDVKCTKNAPTSIAKEYDFTNNYASVPGTSRNCNVSQLKDSDSIKLSSNSDEKSSGQSLSLFSEVSEEEVIYKKNEDSLIEKIINTQNLSIYEPTSSNLIEETLTENGYYILMPKFNPPTKEDIKNTLQEYNIPEIRNQEPFYSDNADVSGSVYIGDKVLKIGNPALNLAEFECHSTSNTLAESRKTEIQKLHPDIELTNNKIKSIKLTFCNTSESILTPLQLPPTRKDVEAWLSIKNTTMKTNVDNTKKKQKLFVPRSPGQSDDEDCDDSIISLSPCSPVNNLTLKDDLSQTPKSSSQCGARKRKPDFINNNKSIRNNLNESKLRKSLLQSQFFHHFDNSLENNKNSSNITNATLDNTHGFKMSLENLQKAKAISESQGLTILAMELHVQTRLDFKPNPESDSIRAIFYSLQTDLPEIFKESGIFTLKYLDSENTVPTFEGTGVTCNVTYVDSEINLINAFLSFIKKWDPDVFVGYEIEMLSWGYLIDRGNALGINLISSLARTKVKLHYSDDETVSGTKLTGRVVLDVWRLLRHEIALQSYTFENIVYHILHKRVPLHSFKDLSCWWEDIRPIYRHKTVNFYLFRVEGILELLDRLDLIGRTSELARLFGIQFYEVLSRGSQFRVESMMLRLAKPLNYVAVSPSVQQRAKMYAPESLPLILEPDSRFYVDPVIVLDFQSLYPSIIIAYNYCFSTCLGKVEHLGQDVPFPFGATQLKISRTLLKKLIRKDLINYSPCGAAFVKSKVREGILPRMLSEILDTRLMVKKSMKENKEDKLLQRVLHNRQLGLKLIANVTYGYTAANFSGRMPAVELGDSVVSKGRETLVRAIKLIENTPRWGAKVVYGDTDSIFVLVPGKSREYAFKIGEEIADSVTNSNPSPVKLKLEKIFQPCILQTKKRYVGYMYESPDQKEPEFCAKGIETVRRDGCPAVSKMLEKTLKILFNTRDVSAVRKYVVRQFTKLLSGRSSIQDLIFAKEYRGASNYKPGACIPALELTRKWLSVDKRSEPRRGERVPYVIVNGPPGLPIIKLVRSPRELLNDHNLHLNVIYYITRVIIPPINRCFNLIGADLMTWYNNMPRKYKQNIPAITPDSISKKSTISDYFIAANCVCCNRQAQEGLCLDCSESPQTTVALLQNKIRGWERSCSQINMICQSCSGHPAIINCLSLDCPVMYSSNKGNLNLQRVPYIQQIISDYFDI